MERTPFPPRKAPLPRSALPCPTERKPRAPRRTQSVEERLARRLLRQRSGGWCEVDRAARSTDYSHRIGAGVGGTWSVANAIAMCREHHTWLHAHPALARAGRGWRLLSTDVPVELPALLAGGWFLLDVEGGATQVDEADALAVLAA